MRLFSLIELPHWLMIGGAILTAIGFLGLALVRNKEVATTHDPEPPAPRSKMPPLPTLLDSLKETNDRDDHPAPRRTRAEGKNSRA
jgi:hypothetical protein